MAIFKQRRGTAAALAAANETPAAGQIVFEIDTNRMKVGNGVTPYNALPFIGAQVTATIGDVTGLAAALAGKADTNHTHTVSSIVDLNSTLQAGYASLTHSHTVSSITGLQAALDGKAQAQHIHYVSDIVQLWDWLDTKVNLTDSRLTDQRVPTDGSVTSSKLSPSIVIDCGAV